MLPKILLNQELPRCEWVGNDPMMIDYHDQEWGVPLHDDHKLFELFILETFQAGLSWKTILHKRNHFRKAFDEFHAEKIVQYKGEDILRLMQDSGIIRNQRKIQAVISNASTFLALQQQYGSFDQYIWQFTKGQTLPRQVYDAWNIIPCSSSESIAMSKDLIRKGFSFAGPIICYSFMQSAGMVDDHTNQCFRRGSDYSPIKN